MSIRETPFSTFLKDLMRRRKRNKHQFAADLGISHVTVARWLSGVDIPRPGSCRKLADYSGIPVESILSFAGHMPQISETESSRWPEFREYIQKKYPEELDDDLISVIEDLIERRRTERYEGRRTLL